MTPPGADSFISTLRNSDRLAGTGSGKSTRRRGSTGFWRKWKGWTFCAPGPSCPAACRIKGWVNMLVTYIEGEDAAEALPRLPVGEQESIGIHDGRELRKIHRASVPDEAEPCHDRILARLRSYRQDYEACGVCLDRGRELLEFLQEHIGLTEGRRSVLQHHDYHAGNLIVYGGEPDGRFLTAVCALYRPGLPLIRSLERPGKTGRDGGHAEADRQSHR
ncbi:MULTISPECIES: phosphotransferase family protein [unclassified Paenibacillus]|nr:MULTISPECIES: phosphotransferase [unclassified Paenibacillus]